MFDAFFDLKAHGTTVQREFVAGATTFFTMAYIMFVNPMILSAAGMDKGAVFVATCLAAGLTTLLMGLYAKLPVALAPGMGLNAYFAYTVVPALNGDWRLALGCVFLSGILFVGISITPAREWLINALPHSLKLAIAAGIGFFLALIGLENAGVVVASADTLVQGGILTDPKVLIAAGAFIVIFALAARGVIGAVLLGIVGATGAAIAFGLQAPPVLSAPLPSIAPTFLAMHFNGAAGEAILTSVLVFLLVDMLDTSGTLTAVAYQGKLLDENGRLKNARRALTSDAVGTMIGAALGTSPVTAYIESASGIQAGGRSGLTAVVVGILFLLSLVLSPLAGAVPAYATAPALVFVAALMAKGLKDIDWDDMTEAAPALLTALAIPFTYSIATGIGIGFIAYVAIKLISGRWRDVNAAVVVIALAFVAKIAWGT
ncbi:MAG: NCS2 family permease [Alphaproteobacteria bacterium]|nr:NCS2 family permease [Alphaproteobacteria bacterium]MDE1986834.1 NCS2 family permease [Alphaproteobacteria bacterium]MDE2163527.1 NCS2 family permease [Alphaproteobacteria bacterium]MDE2499314.1 NCS2 family permease [Alphaproteobacteria bacterium]